MYEYRLRYKHSGSETTHEIGDFISPEDAMGWWKLATTDKREPDKVRDWVLVQREPAGWVVKDRHDAQREE